VRRHPSGLSLGSNLVVNGFSGAELNGFKIRRWSAPSKGSSRKIGAEETLGGSLG
jgi:hypothetical protein